MASKILKPNVIKDATLFIANLNWTTGQNELKKYFSKYGNIARSTVVFDKDTGLSKGYGFVTFLSDESVKDVLKTEHSLEGRKLMLTIRNPRRN